MSYSGEKSNQETLRACTTHALDALGALKEVNAALRRLPVPAGGSEVELHEHIARMLKQVHSEMMQVLFVTSLVVDSTMPQRPRQH
jgi:hypothetical protein